MTAPPPTVKIVSPPLKPEPWSGVCQRALLRKRLPISSAYRLARRRDDGIPGDDCLRSNVGSPGMNDNRKRPVMVWLHGGGFASGSGQELLSYDGENLCRNGDVVVVTLNHRLNTFRYLHLAEFGGDHFASSGNVGMLDLVLALEWVRDNIANFGGDPSNVMIFGQSGGGAKVNTLMAMPSAKGLFHRAATQSDSMLRVAEPEDFTRLAAAVVDELNISRTDIAQLQKRLWLQSLSQIKPLIPSPLLSRPRCRCWWGPCSTNLSPEPVTRMRSISRRSTRLRLAATYGDKSTRIIETFRKGPPSRVPVTYTQSS